MAQRYNSITAKFYDRSTLAEIPDHASDGARLTVERSGSIYPGGYGAASLWIERDPTAPLPFTGGDMVRLYNGPRVVYEGFVASISHVIGASARGVRIALMGAWGWLMRKTKEKRWADDRVDADVWVEPLDAWDANDKTPARVVYVDRSDGRIRLTPKGEAFALNQWHRLVHQQPTGETTKRVKCSFALQEGGQAWWLFLQNLSDATYIINRTTSGTATVDSTLATPCNRMFLGLFSQAAQTPTSDGTYYAQIDDAISGATALMVYSESSSINATEVFKDVRAMVSELSSDESMIDTTLTATVEPFITQGREALSSILARIASFGTPTYGAIGYGIKDGTQSSDGKPILFAEPWPALTDYEYEIAFSDKQLGDTLEVVRDYAGIVNWVVVEYQDGTNKTITLTPDDDANLKDQTSIDAYGERHASQPLRVGNATQAVAVAHARRYLAAKKDPQVYVSGSIAYRGTMRGKNGQVTPVANVMAGERCKIVDFIADVIDVASAGMTAVITSAEYSDVGGGTVRLSFGVPDNLAIMLARGVGAISGAMAGTGSGRTAGGLTY